MRLIRLILQTLKKAIKEIYDLTDGRGVDVAIEAVGIPATFDFCQKIIGVDGTVANCGVMVNQLNSI